MALDDGDLVGREVVEFIDQTVDLAVERGAFALIEVLVALRSRGGELLLCFEHLIDELNYAVMTSCVRWSLGVNRANRYSRHVLINKSVAVFAGADTKRNTDIADCEPKQTAIEQAEQVKTVCADAISCVR